MDWEVPASLSSDRQISRYLQQPYWHATGFLSGDLKVLVASSRRQYDATNQRSLSATEARTLDQKRQEVEEVTCILKSELSLDTCQAGTSGPSRRSTCPRRGLKSPIWRSAWQPPGLWSMSISTREIRDAHASGNSSYRVAGHIACSRAGQKSCVSSDSCCW